MIRRPLMYLTSAFAAAVIVSYYFDTAAAIAPAAVFVCAFALCKKNMFLKTSLVCLITAGYMCGVLLFAFHDAQESVLEHYSRSNIEVEMKIIHLEKRESLSFGKRQEYLQVRADIISAEGELPKNRECILLRIYDARSKSAADIIPGSVIRAKGEISLPRGRRNPGCFDYALYLKTLGIENIMMISEFEVCISGKNSVEGRLYMFKEHFLQQLEKAADEETSGFMRAIMFGEKTELDDETMEEFQKNGTAHVLAVSGLHIGMIYACFSRLWRWRKTGLYFTVAMVFLFSYAAMASFTPSVMRAVLMIMLHIFSQIANRRYDLASAAFLVAFVLLLRNPMYLFNAGFQMSFLAVLTLSLMIPLMKKFYRGMFMAGICVQFGLAPYTAYMFNCFSAVGFLVNVPVVFMTGIIVPMGMALMATMPVSDFIFGLLSAVVSGLCEILKWINSVSGIDGLTVFEVTSPDIRFVAMYYLVLLVFVSEEGRLMIMRRKKRTCTVMIGLVFFCTFAFNTAAGNHFKNTDLVFVDVGQGDCMHLRTDNGKNYLIDGGGSADYNVGKKTLKPYLLKNGARFADAAFVTHLHTDHYKGIEELCREGMVRKLFLYEGCKVKEDEIVKSTGLEPENLIYLYEGQTVRLDDDLSVEIFNPQRRTEDEYARLVADENDENEQSLVFKVSMEDVDLIVTGDIGEACQDELAEKYGKRLYSDILKVPHHGSKYNYSEKFTANVKPKYAVFQVGNNNFGHPDKGVIENYFGKGIMVYRTDINGAVAFEFSHGCVDKIMTAGNGK